MPTNVKIKAQLLYGLHWPVAVSCVLTFRGSRHKGLDRNAPTNMAHNNKALFLFGLE